MINVGIILITDKNEPTSPPPQPIFVALIRGGGKLVPYAKKEGFFLILKNALVKMCS